jgi:serine/threonine protein kinase
MTSPEHNLVGLSIQSSIGTREIHDEDVGPFSLPIEELSNIAIDNFEMEEQSNDHDEDYVDDDGDHDADVDDPCKIELNTKDQEGRLMFYPTCIDCKICCALPFRRSTKDDESEGILWDDASPWDWDGGLYDLVTQLNGRDQYPKLPADIAKTTVEATAKHLTQLKEQLIQAGLQKHVNQNYCGESLSSSRVIAPFDFSELELGNLLGNGGFSSVSEIVNIRPISRSSRRFHIMEEKSRQYIMKNVLCNIENCSSVSTSPKKVLDSTTKNDKSNKTRNRHGLFCTQYAVKHLRNRLVTRTPEKFKRAAIDLIMEGQLLLVLDHPNIVGLRGWCGDGPKAFASRDPRGFFLILDKLPVSLEDRMLEWRNKQIKYQRQLTRQTISQQRTNMVTSWARKALRRNQKEETTPSAPTIKTITGMQDLLVERLKVAYNIGQAIQYLHSKRLIHRDLKVANVGFDIYGQVKLFDFGLSRLLPLTSDQHVNSARSDTLSDCVESTTIGSMSEIYVMSRVGTKFYMAPEVRRKEPYSLPADVYSFGVVLWEILTLSTPREFYHHERDRISKSSKDKCSKGEGDNTRPNNLGSTNNLAGNDGAKGWLPICPCWPIRLQELVSSTMANDPMGRPSMEQILIILHNHIEALSTKSRLENNIVQRRASKSQIDLTSMDLRILDNIRKNEKKRE